MPALAITDFTNLCGLVKFYGTAHGAGLKPIVGADFHVQSDLLGDEMTQISVLAMNNTGYQNLTLLISKAYQRGYGALGPWIDRDWPAGAERRFAADLRWPYGRCRQMSAARVIMRWWISASRSTKSISRIVITWS